MKAKYLIALPLFTFVNCSNPAITDNRGPTSGASDATPKTDPVTPTPEPTKHAIVELGISKDQLKALLKEEPFKSDWVSLNLDRSSLKREIFNKLFGRAKTQILDNTRQLFPLSGDYIINKDCNAANAISTETCVFPTDISNNATNLNIQAPQ